MDRNTKSNKTERIFMPKETIRAKGLEIGIYTNDFNNEFISLTDIARCKSKDPFIVVCN